MRRLRAFLAPLLALAATACEFDRTTIAVGAPALAVHAVLNPGSRTVSILVESVLTGRTRADTLPGFNPSEPILRNGGEPVRGARVVVYGPGAGDSAVAPEVTTTRPFAIGAGVYRLDVSSSCGPRFPGCIVLVPGQRYRLRVASGGQVVTGETTIPRTGPVGDTGPFAFLFDRDRDTLDLAWRSVPLARRYALRIESPRGPFTAFLADTAYAVAGTLRNPFEETLPSVFMPGFLQGVTVAAVDSNYYDYFRSSSDPFTGTGLINRLEGGIGVFGSWVMVSRRTLSVVAPVDEPIEGVYRLDRPGAEVRLWVESRARGTTYLSGRYVVDRETAQRGVLGLLAGTQLTLAFLEAQLASDTSFVFRGTMDADGTARGTVTSRVSAAATLVKRP